MKKSFLFTMAIAAFAAFTVNCKGQSPYNNSDFKLLKAEVTHSDDLKHTVWNIQVQGKAGATTPRPAGQLNGAPVLGYVFPTTLKSIDVGFGDVDGIVALALTSHPDFDDTPLWDENTDRVFDNDGIVWHPHWVILTQDQRVAGGLSVKQFDAEDTTVVLPPTNPGMPMYMDSPGFQVVTNGKSIKVVVPDYRINNQINFSFDAVAAFMKVNTENSEQPLLGVYEVYNVLSGDLSLPFDVKL